MIKKKTFVTFLLYFAILLIFALLVFLGMQNENNSAYFGSYMDDEEITFTSVDASNPNYPDWIASLEKLPSKARFQQANFLLQKKLVLKENNNELVLINKTTKEEKVLLTVSKSQKIFVFNKINEDSFVYYVTKKQEILYSGVFDCSKYQNFPLQKAAPRPAFILNNILYCTADLTNTSTFKTHKVTTTNLNFLNKKGKVVNFKEENYTKEHCTKVESDIEISPLDCSISPNGKYYAVTSQIFFQPTKPFALIGDQMINVYDIQTGEEIFRSEIFSDKQSALAPNLSIAWIDENHLAFYNVANRDSTNQFNIYLMFFIYLD